MLLGSTKSSTSMMLVCGFSEDFLSSQMTLKRGFPLLASIRNRIDNERERNGMENGSIDKVVDSFQIYYQPHSANDHISQRLEPKLILAREDSGTRVLVFIPEERIDIFIDVDTFCPTAL